CHHAAGAASRGDRAAPGSASTDGAGAAPARSSSTGSAPRSAAQRASRGGALERQRARADASVPAEDALDNLLQLFVVASHAETIDGRSLGDADDRVEYLG